MWFLIQIFLLFLYGTGALDRCPNAALVKNFNLVEDYCFGKWYSLARYNLIVIEEDADCVYYEYYISPDGEECDVTLNKAAANKKVVYPGHLRQIPNPENLASITDEIYYQGEINSKTLNFIDFQSGIYALIYSCDLNDTLNDYVVYAWVVSPTIQLSTQARAAVLNSIEESGFLDPSQFMWTDFNSYKCAPIFQNCSKRH